MKTMKEIKREIFIRAMENALDRLKRNEIDIAEFQKITLRIFEDSDEPLSSIK